MKRAIVLVLLVGSFLVLGLSSHAASAMDEQRVLTVMTRNMDEGTDYGPLLTAASFPALLSAVAATYNEVVASDIPGRAAAVAVEIKKAQPDLVGLQEATLWRTGPLNTPPIAPAAQDVVADVLQSLLMALDQQGLHYAVVALSINLDADLPDFAIGKDFRVTNRDAIIARTDLPPGHLKLSNVQAQHFTTNLVLSSPILGHLTVPRSWLSVDTEVRGKTARFVTTHLEPVDPGVQAAQAGELIQGPGNTTMPVVFAGDLNSAPSGTLAPHQTYNNLIAAGFTCCLYTEDPFTPGSLPSGRIDLVFLRGDIHASEAALAGGSPADQIHPGLYPSDHLGVVARVDYR